VDAPLLTSIGIPLPGDGQEIPGAIAQFDGKLFAGIAVPPAIAVFLDRPPYTRLQDIKVAGMKYPSSMVACKESKCLYVADETVRCIWRTTLEGAVDKFICLHDHMVDSDNLFQISLSNRAGRFVATLRAQCKLLVLGSDGQEQFCINTLRIKSDFCPRDAAETTRETFVVSLSSNTSSAFSFDDNYLVEVDKAGTLIREYNLGEVDIGRLALDRAGNVICVDSEDDHVLLLSSKLKLFGRLLTCGRNEDLHWIRDLSYDDSTGQLLLLSGEYLCLYHIK